MNRTVTTYDHLKHGSKRHYAIDGPYFVKLKGHDTCHMGWCCPDERHNRWPKTK